MAGVLRPHPRSYWIDKLTAAGVPCGSVRDLREVFSDPQLAAREMIVPMHHAAAGDIRVLGTPIKLSDTPAAMRAAPPTLGEHTDSVLAQDLGLGGEVIGQLRATGVV